MCIRDSVWAIGVVLYELLTGALPFDGDSLPELCTAILHRPPTPLLQVRPYLPAELQQVLDQCLAKDVESRFQNVAELAQELRPFAGPVGCERIDQVVRVILGAGDRVRPSIPSPRVSSVSALAEALTLVGPADRLSLIHISQAGQAGPELVHLVQPVRARVCDLPFQEGRELAVVVELSLIHILARSRGVRRPPRGGTRTGRPRPPRSRSSREARACLLYTSRCV